MKARNKSVPNRFRQYVIATCFAPLISEFLLFVLDFIHFVETSYIKNK